MEDIDSFVNYLATQTGKTADMVRIFILTEPLVGTNAIQRLNLHEIKMYLSYFKNRIGYPGISLQKNKSDSINLLRATMLEFRNSAQVQSGAPAPPQQHEPKQPQNRIPAAQHANANQANQISQLEMQLGLKTPREVAVYKDLLTMGFCNQEAAKCVQEATMEEMRDPELLAMNFVMKKSANDNPNHDDDESDDDSDDGSDDDEDNDDEDEDSMNSEAREEIIAAKERKRIKRQKKAAKKLRREQEDLELKEQEDKDMDMAILNSEGEREFIRNRKRQRLNDLKGSCSCALGEAEEFKHSVLAGAVGHNNSKSALNKYTLQSNPKDAMTSNLMKALGLESQSSECELIRVSLRLLDSMCCEKEAPAKRQRVEGCAASSSSSSSTHLTTEPPLVNGNSSSSSSSSSASADSSVCHCSAHVIHLRSLVSRLLLLEQDTLKFFEDKSLAYFISVSKRIDRCVNKEELERSFKSPFGDVTDTAACSSNDCAGVATAAPTVTTTTAASTDTVATSSNVSQIADAAAVRGRNAVGVLCGILATECCLLETAIYAIPSEQNMIPKILRDAQPPGTDLGLSNLEEDGFEIC